MQIRSLTSRISNGGAPLSSALSKGFQNLAKGPFVLWIVAGRAAVIRHYLRARRTAAQHQPDTPATETQLITPCSAFSALCDEVKDELELELVGLSVKAFARHTCLASRTWLSSSSMWLYSSCGTCIVAVLEGPFRLSYFFYVTGTYRL